MSSNTIIIEQGRIGKDPELKYSKNDLAMLSLSVCTSDSYKKDGEWVNESNWHEVKFFGKAAEKVAEEAQKGGEIYLRGHVKTESWDTQDGKRTKQVVMPDLGHLHIYPPRQRSESRDDGRRKESPRSDGGRGKRVEKDPWDEEKDGDGGPYGDEPNW